MARPVKLYNHSLPPTRVGFASSRRKRASNSRWKKLIFWPGKAARLNSSRRTRQARCLCSNLMTVHTSPNLVAICRYLEGLQPEPNLLGREPREQAEIERWEP